VVNRYVGYRPLPGLALWEKAERRRLPLSFDLEVTSRCNNDCRHCCINLPAGDRGARDSELTLPEIERFADEAVALGSLWCLVTGGEPLLREDFVDIYMALKRRGLLVSVFTNACLVGEEHVELFRRYPPRDLEVTVYGATRETYERVAQKKGSYSSFRRGVDRLLNGGLHVRFKAMAIRSNAHELAEIARFCRDRSSDYFRFDPVLHLRYDRDPLRNEMIRGERLSPEEVVALEVADEERSSALRDACDELILKPDQISQSARLFRCGAGVRTFAISSDATFRLCSSLWDPRCLYDLRAGSLGDAWENFVPSVRQMVTTDEEYARSCAACEVINLCRWCPAHAQLEGGELDGPVPYFCAVANKRAEVFRADENA
jgi:radical SAM protein with 4Fe4S-binding SPASM domain